MLENFREYRTLGRTGLKVSRLGIGTGYGIPGKVIEKAFHEYGVNYFYLSSPRRRASMKSIGDLARNNRDNVVIVLQSYDHFGPFMSHFLEKGLKTLKINYTDVLLLGWNNKIPSGKVLDEALKLKEQGKVRFLGMSGHKRTTFSKVAQMKDSPIDIFMIRYNAVHSGAEKDIFPHLPEDNRQGITIYTATCWKKLLKAKSVPEGEKPVSAPDAYRFVLSNPNVDLCMTGAANEEQMDDALTVLDKGPLNEEEMERIRRIGSYIYDKKLNKLGR
ncbi:aldo/keto reductase [candidate division KSB1 bacterium]